jgi:hypothetical protein
VTSGANRGVSTPQLGGEWAGNRRLLFRKTNSAADRTMSPRSGSLAPPMGSERRCWGGGHHRHRAGRQAPVGCVLAVPPPSPYRSQGAMEQAETGHAAADQVRVARDVTTMFDELKALADRHAELHADRARLQADVERLASELEQARRPWWQRLIGR